MLHISTSKLTNFLIKIFCYSMYLYLLVLPYTANISKIFMSAQ